MSRFLLIFALVAAAPVWAGPKEDFVTNNKNRRAAFELFRDGHGAEAEARFSAGLVSGNLGDRRSLEVAKELLGISAQLYNVRKIEAACDATNRAAALGKRLLPHKELGSDLADLFARIGFMEEQLFFDEDAAQAAYQTALELKSDQPQALARAPAVQRKLALRKKILGR